tara:strand:- start:1654 stop:2511 length:858 start_codon:yes stop_codon:yes gene_type:complete
MTNSRSYSFILNFLKKNKLIMVENDIKNKFEMIKKNNTFKPIKYVKKFNYTNWKKSTNKEDEIKKNTDDINKEKINLLFNKISKKTFTVMLDNIIKIIELNTEYLNHALQQLFNLATSQHIYITLYSQICKKLTDKYGEQVEKTILNYCKEYYKQYSLIDKKNDTIEDTLDITHKQSKEKEKIIGTFQLVGELYQFNLVNNFVIEKYLNLLLNKLKKNADKTGKNEIKLREQYIECLKGFLIKVKTKLSSLKRDEIVKKINYLLSDKLSFSKREQFMFMDILDFL